MKVYLQLAQGVSRRGAENAEVFGLIRRSTNERYNSLTGLSQLVDSDLWRRLRQDRGISSAISAPLREPFR